MDKETYKNRLNDKPESLICEWDSLRKMMWSENIQYHLEVCWRGQKSRAYKDRVILQMAQNDLTEFLQFVAECFHESIVEK